MKALLSTVTAASFALLLGAAQAAEPAKAPAAAPAKKETAAPAKAGDPTGTWTYAFERPDGEKMERTVKLKKEGDKLTGSTTGRDGAEVPLQEVQLKDGTVSFKTVRERDGQKFTTSFTGKLEGDVIKGTMTSNWGGEERKRPWEAKRAPAK